jgi:polar amino acid transport system substrate-binding protein
VAVCAYARILSSYGICPWWRVRELIWIGDADGMMVMSRNPKRGEWACFSPPRFRAEYGVFVKADNRMRFTDISQLEL